MIGHNNNKVIVTKVSYGFSFPLNTFSFFCNMVEYLLLHSLNSLFYFSNFGLIGYHG